MSTSQAVAGCVLTFTSLLACAAPQTVKNVDLDRYIGTWYEIARLPNSFQDECASNVTAEYRKRTDGRLDVINRCRRSDGSLEEAQGVARVANQEMKAQLKVRFAPAWLSWLSATWVDFWVLYLAPDYSVSAVGTPSRKSLWILSRTPEISEEGYRAITAHLARQGYDVEKLTPTVQQR